jgi:prolipoprotein diacylglyceryltransferase
LAHPTTSVLVAPGFLHGTIWATGSFPFFATEFVDPASVCRHELLGLALYPTQLLDMGGLLTLVLLTQVLWSFRRFDGQIAALAFAVQAVLRIVIESFRADQRGYALSWSVEQVPSWLPPGLLQAGGALPKVGAPMVVGLTTSQGIGLGIIVVAIAILVVRRNAGVAPEVALEEDRG